MPEASPINHTVASQPSIFKGAALHALAVLLCYTLLFAIFFSPVLFSDYLLAPGDGILYFLPNYYAPRVMWDTSLWAGFPAIADSQQMNWYPPALLLSSVPRTWNLFVLSAYVLAASFTYGYVHALARSRLAAGVSGCVYGLCGFLLAHLGHPALIHVAAWLPLCLWAFEMLRRREASSLWFAGGALGIACAALAGHPQMFAYTLILCAAAILCGGRDAGIGRWRYYRRAALSATLGVGLAALLLVPTAELASQSLRASLSFTEFNSYSLPLRQLPMLVFPLLYGGSPGTLYDVAYFGKWPSEDGGWGAAELTGYVGLLPLMLAAVGVFAHRRRALVWFWIGVAFVALLLTLGEATPLAALIYRLPVLNKFRVPARHFMELALAVSVLAGIGVRAIQERAASGRLITNILLTAFALMSACLLVVQLLAGQLNARAAEKLGHAISFAPWANPAVGVPLVLLLAGGAALFYWARRPDSAWRGALLVAVLICDLSSLGWFLEWHYAPPYDAYTQAPAAAGALRGPLAAAHQRIIPVRGGLGRVSELPPNLSKLWGFDSASGYGPFIPSRLSRLLTMPPHGSLDGDWRAPADQSLDLLAARYVIVPRQETNAPLIADARGARWAAQDFGASVGRGCGTTHPDVFQLDLPSPVEATSVGIVSALACAEGLGDQTEIARITVTSIDGRTQALHLRAGSESSEWAYDCADVRPLMRHARAEVFRSYPATRGTIKCEGHDYVARLSLPFGATRITSVAVRWTGAASGSLALKRINFFDERSHQATPLHASAASLSDPSRWRHVADISFANSDYGEEVKPEDVGASRVYENLRARPRAWLVPEVLTLAAEQAADAIRTSRLPDHRAFAPSRLALVEEPLAFKAESFDPQASAQIVRLTDSVMEVRTRSAAPAFLVTSDVYYPGWRVAIDGEPAQLYRANYVLRGVPLPAGEHLVRFSFRPASFYYGAGISAASLLILIALAFSARRGETFASRSDERIVAQHGEMAGQYRLRQRADDSERRTRPLTQAVLTSHPFATSLKPFVTALMLLAWLFFLYRAVEVFHPGSSYVQLFNSDNAILLLMANDETIDAFNTYAYGQDQFGAWPYLCAQLVRRLTGQLWTAQSFYIWQTIWLFLSVPVVFCLSRRRRGGAFLAALYLAVLCLHPTVSHYLFVTNQRYAWQVTALLLGWWSLRRICERPPSPSRVEQWRFILWHALAFWFSFLSIWMSPVSVPMLCALYALEVVRARLMASPAPPVGRRLAWRVLVGLAPVVAAAFAEMLLKANYHRHALKHFGKDYHTPMEFDRGFLTANLQAQWAVFNESVWWPLSVIALLASVALTAYLINCLWPRLNLSNMFRAFARRAGTSPTPTMITSQHSPLCQDSLFLDHSIFVLGATAIALINFAGTIMFSWIRLNSYGPRYLALTHFFGTLGGLLALSLVVSLSRNMAEKRSFIFPTLALCLAALLLFKFPAERENPQYRELQNLAAALAQKAPRIVLLGGYWDTYVFAGLQPDGTFVPVPAENQEIKTPWTPQLLRRAPQVVVVHHPFPEPREVEAPYPYRNFGGRDAPQPIINQHETQLRLAEPKWHEQGDYTFSLYLNQKGDGVAEAP